MIEKLAIFLMRKKEKVSKIIFYFIYIHTRIHFVLLNMFLSGGVFFNTRTLLHMKLYPETWVLTGDKILALLVFLFYWIDIIEMLKTSL